MTSLNPLKPAFEGDDNTCAYCGAHIEDGDEAYKVLVNVAKRPDVRKDRHPTVRGTSARRRQSTRCASPAAPRCVSPR